ncbi:MAG: HlyD family efflux transporter periplasmic adaptor subunit [Sporichthyaceae bacterium]
MRRKTVVVNTGLALVLLAAAVGAVLQIKDPDAPVTPEQTAMVVQGPVSSTVNTTGNLNAPRTVGLPFQGQPGVVQSVDVKVGDTIKPGQQIASVDDRLAKNQLRHAKAALKAAQAQLLAATEGQTAQEAELDRANIAFAIQQLGNAQLAVSNAREKRRAVASEQGRLVGSASESFDRSHRQITRQTQAAEQGTRASTASVPPAPGDPQNSETNQRQRSRSITAVNSSSAVDSARNGLVQAEVGASSALTDANQALRNTRHQATLAARQLHIARAQAKVNAQGGRASERAAAKAQIADALATIADARVALANTVLRAPFEATVVDIAGGVGETPVGAVRGTTSSSVVPAGPGSAENRKAATQAGFVILADLTTKYVTAAVNEADIGKIKVGQPANVVFPATGSAIKAKVQEIDLQENVVNNVVQYNVKLELEPTPERLGQSASVQIVTADRQNVLSVPNAAIIRAGDQSLLQVRRPGQDQDMKIPVTPGLVGDQTTEVTSPLLRAGDVVILPGTGSGAGRGSGLPSRGRGAGGG